MVTDRAIDAACAAFLGLNLPLQRFSASRNKMRAEVRKMLEAAAAAIDVLALREALALALYEAMCREVPDEEDVAFESFDDEERAAMFRLADAALAVRLDAFAVFDVRVG